MIGLACLIAGWIGCGILAYGATFAYFQGRFASIAHLCRTGDRIFAIFIGILGPIGLLLATILGVFFRYGLKFK